MNKTDYIKSNTRAEEIWDFLYPELKKAGIQLEPVDIYAFENLIRFLIRKEGYEAELDQAGATYASKDLIKSNPLNEQIRLVNIQINEMFRRFGMTPYDRSKIIPNKKKSVKAVKGL